jgi:hypothetical protein
MFSPLCTNSAIPPRGLIVAGLLCALQAGSLVNAASVVVGLTPAVFGQITPSQVITPASHIPYLGVQGDNREDPFPSRLVIEFSLAGIPSSIEVLSAKFSATGFGGSLSGPSALKMSLFGYAGSGLVNLDTGIDPGTGASIGPVLSGPFTINSFTSPNLSNIDVTSYIRSLIDAGATHAGFMFRAVDTPVDAVTRTQYIVVQDVAAWAGDTPPALSLTLVPEPSTSLLAIATGVLLLRRRSR